MLGKHQETGWCMPCIPYAGDKAGIAFLPEEGAGVWIEFEGGNVSYPIWVGCYWHLDEVPSRVAPEVKVIKTKGNQQIVLDDKDHVITITDSSNNSVKLDRDGITILRDAQPKAGKLVVTSGKVAANDGAMEVT
ncbi:MAG: baseplate assembly protein [Rhodospirillales bacterium]|nr:baseplate assembly protein [Rhodospirillales bacterium]